MPAEHRATCCCTAGAAWRSARARRAASRRSCCSRCCAGGRTPRSSGCSRGCSSATWPTWCAALRCAALHCVASRIWLLPTVRTKPQHNTHYPASRAHSRTQVRDGFGGVWAADASGLSFRSALGAASTSSSAAAHDPIEAEHAIYAARLLGVTAFPALLVLAPSAVGGSAHRGVAAVMGLDFPQALHRSTGADALALAVEPDSLMALLMSTAEEGAAAEAAARPAREAQEADDAAHAAAVGFEAEKVARWIARDFRLVIFGGAEGIELCSPKQPVPAQHRDGGGGGGGGGSDELPIRVRGYPSALLKALGAVEDPRGAPRVAICSNQGGALLISF